MQDIDFPKPKIHLFVCINDRAGIPHNDKPSCGPRIKADDVKKVKEDIAAGKAPSLTDKEHLH